MLIRAYTELDAEATLDVFLRAIRTTASRDYTPEQIAAWAPGDIDLTSWNAKRSVPSTVVATIGARVVGFTDVDARGYIDMMFVDPDFGRQGVASQLMAWIMQTARDRTITELSAHGSLTARPFFEKHGFVVLEQRYPVRGSVTLTNFDMRRSLPPRP